MLARHLHRLIVHQQNVQQVLRLRQARTHAHVVPDRHTGRQVRLLQVDLVGRKRQPSGVIHSWRVAGQNA